MIEFPDKDFSKDFRMKIPQAVFLSKSAWDKVDLAPPTDMAAIEIELDELEKFQQDRAGRILEIKYQDKDPYPYFEEVVGFRTPDTTAPYELLVGVIQVAAMVVYAYKDRFKRARPTQLRPTLTTVLPVPGHAAFPSGHSFQMHLIAGVLTELFPKRKNHLSAVAWRIAENREYAGLHYRSDTEAGKKLAEALLPDILAAFGSTIERARIELKL